MENFVPFLFEHAGYAHWVIFSLFFLAAINIPISEDLLIIISGVLASTVVPENTWKLFVAVFLGAYLSDWIPYFLGRIFGPNLWNLRWFARMIKRERLEQIARYYKKYGIMTLLVGRFIPFGVRNCLFVTAGLGQMPILKFIIFDGIAALISNTTLFTLSYYFGRSYGELLGQLKIVNIVIFSLFIVAVIALVWYKRRKVAEKKID